MHGRVCGKVCERRKLKINVRKSKMMRRSELEVCELLKVALNEEELEEVRE